MSSEVSVLIPAHGASPFIEFTLHSIVDSSVQPDEVLIVNDGLSENAISKIQSFSNYLPISLISNTGKGLVDALNTGLSASECKYICRIDGDDQMSSSRIETQVEFLNSNVNVVAVGTQCDLIDSRGFKIGKTSYPVGCISKLESFSVKCLLAHPSTMYLRQAAVSIGGYRRMFRWMQTDIAEDFDFWLRLRSQGEIFIIDEYLTKYRVHSGQISSQFNAAQLVGTAYIAAGNFTESTGNDFEKIEFSRENISTELVKFNSILAESPFILHRVIARLQVKELLQLGNSRLRFFSFAIRFVIRCLNFLFRVYVK